MQPQMNDLKYLYSAIEIQALCNICASYVYAEVEDGLEECIKKTSILESIENQIIRIIKLNLEKKIEMKETLSDFGNSIDARVKNFQVDPINEVLLLNYELSYIRYLFNELVISDEKFKLAVNDKTFAEAKSFASEFIKSKFPLVIATESTPAKPEETEPVKEEPCVESVIAE